MSEWDTSLGFMCNILHISGEYSGVTVIYAHPYYQLKNVLKFAHSVAKSSNVNISLNEGKNLRKASHFLYYHIFKEIPPEYLLSTNLFFVLLVVTVTYTSVISSLSRGDVFTVGF